MKTFQELKRTSKLVLSGISETRLTLMGNCATQLLATAVKGYGTVIKFCQFKQIFPMIKV